jgi:hypothetical protein
MARTGKNITPEDICVLISFQLCRFGLYVVRNLFFSISGKFIPENGREVENMYLEKRN